MMNGDDVYFISPTSLRNDANNDFRIEFEVIVVVNCKFRQTFFKILTIVMKCLTLNVILSSYFL